MPSRQCYQNAIPIEPGITTYRIKIQQDKGHTVQKTVQRKQFPITAAYAFTDYCSQGQTLPDVIIDIASPSDWYTQSVCRAFKEQWTLEGRASGCYVISTTSSSWHFTIRHWTKD
jgi:hypothetical protein